MKLIIAERVIHNGVSRIALKFPYNKELISVLKGLPGARWSNTMRCWHISDDEEILKTASNMLADKAVIDLASMASRLNEKQGFGIGSGDIGKENLEVPAKQSLSGIFRNCLVTRAVGRLRFTHM